MFAENRLADATVMARTGRASGVLTAGVFAHSFPEVVAVASDEGHTVSDAMERFKEYEWLANCDQNNDGSWKMLYAPSADPAEEVLDSFWEDMDYLMESIDLDHVTEIANGWIVVPEGKE